jgi:glycosyltransferase involved in cell wall biosynthesis
LEQKKINTRSFLELEANRMESLTFLMVSTYYPPHHLGGDATFVSYVSRELARRGHEVHVYYNSRAYELFRGKEQRASDAGQSDGIVKHLYHSRTARFDPVLALSLGMWGKAEAELRRVVKEVQPDVMHWHNTRGLIGRIFTVDQTKNFYTVHDYTPICPKSSLMKPGMKLCDDPRWCTTCVMSRGKPPQLWRIRGNRVIHYPNDLRIIAPSKFVAEKLRNEHVPVNHVLRGFVPDVGAGLTRVSQSGDSIMYMGLLEPHKGLMTLLDAFVRSKDSQGFKLHIIGEGSMRSSLLKRVHKLGLENRISIPGFLSNEQIAAIRGNAAAHIVPSIWYENAPAVALEAMSCGIPVIASEIGGLPEIVTEEAGSDLFAPGNVEQLAGLIVKTWTERDNLGTRRVRARAEYERRFKPEVHISEYLRIINEHDPGT